MGMAFRFREGSMGNLAPRLALAFSQGGSRRMQWNPTSLLPAQTWRQIQQGLELKMDMPL